MSPEELASALSAESRRLQESSARLDELYRAFAKACYQNDGVTADKLRIAIHSETDVQLDCMGTSMTLTRRLTRAAF